MKENLASHAIVIRSFDVFFNQTHVDVVKNDQGNKNRTAYYDIVADIGYSFYSAGTLLKETDIHKSRFHSSRSVISGILAAGPNIVVKRDDAMRIMLENGHDYLNYFFPGEARRSRPLFTGKGFEAVNAAIIKADYEIALTESLRMINYPDKEKAAKACYNCAVLFERKNQPDETKAYLLQSLSLFSLWEARYMLNDLDQ
jgi:tRNA splicing ligase